jgi:microcystin-dependent protein
MSDPFIGEIQIFGFDFAPKGWAKCNGQTLAITQNQALFAVIGTTFGGNGVSTFQLPNLQSRVPVGQGNGQGLSPRVMGATFGEETHVLLYNETPLHNHSVAAISNPTLANNTDVPSPTQFLAQTTFTGPVGAVTNVYVPDSAPKNSMSGAAIGNTGGQSHSNLMPLLAVNFCIALNGIFPSRN